MQYFDLLPSVMAATLMSDSIGYPGATYNSIWT